MNRDKDMFRILSTIKRQTWKYMREGMAGKDSFDVAIDDTIVCSNCGAEYAESIEICEACGWDFQPPPMKNIEPRRSVSRRVRY